MASEASFWITVAWRHKSPCLCGRSRWWIVIGEPSVQRGMPATRGIGWAHDDGTEACVREGA